MIKEAILKVYKHENLTYDEAYATMDEIMRGEASEVQMSAYLTAMSMKGETIEEITASAEAMRAHCVRLLNDEEVLEIVGTGGDGSNTFNISTTSSIVISAAGVPVAKHGNRSASSKCGAADVLEELGVNIHISPEESLNCFNQAIKLSMINCLAPSPNLTVVTKIDERRSRAAFGKKGLLLLFLVRSSNKALQISCAFIII